MEMNSAELQKIFFNLISHVRTNTGNLCLEEAAASSGVAYCIEEVRYQVV